jgi:hypothetical protein
MRTKTLLFTVVVVLAGPGCATTRRVEYVSPQTSQAAPGEALQKCVLQADQVRTNAAEAVYDACMIRAGYVPRSLLPSQR